MTSVSIIVCTRNRAEQVTACLDSIAGSMTASPDIDAELIVVDNGSADDTVEVLERWGAQCGVPFSILHEPEPGLARARNCGLATARNNIFAMTDDDCRVGGDYVARVAAAFDADTGPVVRGGRVDLGDPRDLPITIKTQVEPATYVPGRKLSGFIHGANFMFPRTVYEDVGEFDVRFGAGGRFKSAEDSDYIMRAAIKGYPIVYDPSVVVAHFHGRRSKDTIRDLVAQYHHGDGALYAKHFFRSLIPLKILKGLMVNVMREQGGAFPPDDLLPRPFAFTLGQNWRGAIDYVLHGRGA